MINGTIEGDFIVFEVDHFSLFAIAQTNASVDMVRVEKGNLMLIFWIGSSVLVAIVAVTVALVLKKKAQ